MSRGFLGTSRAAVQMGAVAIAAVAAIPPGATAIAAAPQQGLAPPHVTLRAKLAPKALGASTDVSFGFEIAATGGEPPPLRSFAVSLPAGMGFAASTLGLETCSEQVILSQGPNACPRESKMGSGRALVQAPFGPQTVRETVPASIFMTQSIDGHTTMLLYLEGRFPVIATLVMRTEVVTSKGEFDSVLSTTVPEVPTAPGGQDVSMLALQASIGPSHLLYYKRVHGRTIAYHPHGLNVPETCPRGGFVFRGDFRFQDGSHVRATNSVSCPPSHVRMDRQAGDH